MSSHEPSDERAPEPRRADSYEHPDGTLEVVFHVADDRVLTVREYPDREAFHRGVVGAADAGRHPGVADLPDVEAFREEGDVEAFAEGEDGDEDEREGE